MSKRDKRRRRKKKNARRKEYKVRNHVAIAAFMQPGIKTHPDQKHKQNKEHCRKQIKEEKDD